jgi:hypothetical protein
LAVTRFVVTSHNRDVHLQTIDLPALSVRAAVGSVNKDARTVDVVFSTGASVPRQDYWTGKRFNEVLSMDPAHVRLDRLNAGAPVLDAHSAYSVGDVLGAVQPNSAAVKDKKGTATLRFSKRDTVDPIFNDIADGIISNVSVGYRVYKYVEETPKDGGTPTRTAIDWEPFELSMVPMPADIGARVRSGDKTNTNACELLTRELTNDAHASDGDVAVRLRLARAKSRL